MKKLGVKRLADSIKATKAFRIEAETSIFLINYNPIYHYGKVLLLVVLRLYRESHCLYSLEASRILAFSMNKDHVL